MRWGIHLINFARGGREWVWGRGGVVVEEEGVVVEEEGVGVLERWSGVGGVGVGGDVVAMEWGDVCKGGVCDDDFLMIYHTFPPEGGKGCGSPNLPTTACPLPASS